MGVSKANLGNVGYKTVLIVEDVKQEDTTQICMSEVIAQTVRYLFYLVNDFIIYMRPSGSSYFNSPKFRAFSNNIFQKSYIS